MTDLAKIEEKLNDLAVKMLEKASEEGTTLPHALDVFKFVQGYYLGAKKVNGKSGGDAPPGATMDGLRQMAAAGSDAGGEDQQASEGADDDEAGDSEDD